MEIYERIRDLRKNHLKLTQEEFGRVLGVNRSGINNIEGNRLAKPEQKEPLYKLICKSFNVNYEWLITGEGEMLAETKESFVKRLSNEYGLNFFIEKIIESYLNLDDNRRTHVDGWFDDIAESIRATPASEAVNVVDILAKRTAYNQRKAVISDSVDTEMADDLSLDEQADAFAAMAREQFIKEKKQESKVSFVPEYETG